MADEAMFAGRSYLLKLATQSVSATIQQPKYEINVNTLDHLAAKTLELNGIGVVELSTDKPIVFETYADNHSLGGFILIDKLTNATVAARSEEHTSELQSLMRISYAVFCLKNKKPNIQTPLTNTQYTSRLTIENNQSDNLNR